jgi:hypothetical protein
MFQRSKAIEGLRLRGIDGDVGRVEDLLADEYWVVRYLVVTPGSLLQQRVVISPIVVTGVQRADGRLDIRLTHNQILNSPDLLAMDPLTRDAESAYAAYYGFPAYWGGPGLWAWAGRPGALASPPPASYVPLIADAGAQAMLRSARSLRGRHLMARDGEIGHVDDTIIDDDSWTLPYVLIDTSNWIGGRHVLVPTATVRELNVMDRELAVDLTTDRIRSAPQYDAERELATALERQIREHYGLRMEPKPAPQRASGSRTGR